ncbi:MAG: hypothetical protein WCB68_24225 [Pyrinomonadaceae bacterium]
MSEQDKKLEACGDALLLACARLYLTERHSDVPYQLYTRIIALKASNKTLTRIAEGEGFKGTGEGQHKDADALEVITARFYHRAGFETVREWLWTMFDKYLDVEEEVRKILNPTPDDKFLKQMRGAIKTVVSQRGPITVNNAEQRAAQIVAQLQSNGNHPP